ncbi:hypothetical protein L0Z11_11270 [Burkholderia multivorans]|uniref:hypothetical protein n=1 Tax=Burkholderia multivorans TaxID=87883 RepID=UPI00201894C2|nr:hypothetical protein [Burkholderia multivorans]UQN68265.1 hypothetical protein L0Z45_11290 [Burkholderia multivorans]UQN73994.1 hypothetical protein L0Z11_11270 [Burkholderia multivorans]
MTVTSAIQDVNYVTDGVTVEFPIPFYFLNADDIAVDKIDTNGGLVELVPGTDFTIAGAGNPTGGVLTTTLTYAPGLSLHVYRTVPITQETRYLQNDPFPSHTTEKALDKLTMIAQQNAAAVRNSIRYPISEYRNNGELPRAPDRAAKLLGWDSNGAQTLLPMPATVGAGDLKNETWTDGVDYVSGTSTYVTLSRSYGSKANLGTVVMAGVAQDPATYALTNNGTRLQFDTAIPAGVTRIWCVGGTTVSLNTPAQESVSDTSINWTDILAREVATVADLRNLSRMKYNRASTAGYARPGDYGHAKYYLDAADTVSADNGGSIIVAHDGGRWKLIEGSYLSVLTFGAQPGGVSPAHAAFQAYADWLGARGGGVFNVPGGYVFLLNAPVTFPATSGASSGVSVRGARNASELRPGAMMPSMFLVSGKNFEIEGIFFNNQMGLAKNGLEINTSSTDADYSARVERNRFAGFAAGFKGTGQNYDINKNFFQNNTRHIHFVDDGRNSGIDNNYMLGGNVGIHLAKIAVQAEGTRIINNTILATSGNGAGIQIDAGLEIALIANVIDQTGINSPGVYAPVQAGNTVDKLKIVSNWIAGGEGSYSIFASGNCNEIYAVANSIVSNNGLNIVAGISLDGTNGVTILSNAFDVKGGIDLSFANTVNRTQFGNTSTQSGSNAVENISQQKIIAPNFVVGALTITSGVGVPTANLPSGSVYMRNDGGTGGHLYVSAGGGVWNAVPGV